METSRIIGIISSDKASVVQLENVMAVFADCAYKTTLHTSHHYNVDAIMEQCKDSYMNFANSLFKMVGADTEWQYQYMKYSRASLCYDPEYIHEHLLDGESDTQIFKQDLLMLMKFFFAFNDIDKNSFRYFGLRKRDWKRLSEKYFIEKHELVDFAWTYPYMALLICRIYSDIERPVGMNMLSDYPGFLPEMRFFGLLGIVPRFGQYGGFIKALLHHTVLQIAKHLSLKYKMDFPDGKLHLILHDLIGLARVIYNSEVSEFLTRREFSKYMAISSEDMQSWSMRFDDKYPDYWDIHIRYFEQTD